MSESLDEALARQHQVLTEIAHHVQREGALEDRMAAVKDILARITMPPVITYSTSPEPPPLKALDSHIPVLFGPAKQEVLILGPSLLDAVNAIIQAAPQHERTIWRQLAAQTWDVSTQMEAVIQGEEPDLEGVDL